MRNRLIIFAIILTLIFGFLGFWYYQRNVYSKEVLKLEILGPEETELAGEVEYTVKYKNNGNIRLEEPRLVFEFPKYSILEQGQTQSKEIILDDIYPGEEKTLIFSARLLGKEGETKKAQAWLSYRPKGLKARYESATSKTIEIKSAPIALEFDLPSKIESGKEIRFRLNYFSNASYPLSGLGIKLEYPSGFEFKSSQPKALGQNEWEVGLLNKAEGGRIEIAGAISGEVNEEKRFKAILGSWQDGQFVPLKESIRAVQIVIPSLYITQKINNNPQYIANPGDALHYEIFFKNIGQEAFTNLFLVAKLESQLFDFQTLRAPLGEFEPGDNSIIFDWRKIPELQFLDVQEEGRVDFWIELKKDFVMQNPQDKNQVITNKVYLSQARQEFTTKVNAKLEIIQKAYYQDEVFGNSGPLPPEAGRTTTYTIVWQVKNNYNDVKNVKVKATLGKGVKLTGNLFPEGSRLTFDSSSKEVVWEIGNLIAGQGVFNAMPNVTFQIAFTPQESQRGQIPEVVGLAKAVGEDEWTGATLETVIRSLTTALPDDPAIAPGQGQVQ